MDGAEAKGYNGNMSMTVTLSSELQSYVNSRAAAEGYRDPVEFMQDVVRRDRAAYEADVRRVRALVAEGAASGIVDAEPEDLLDEIIAGLSQPRG